MKLQTNQLDIATWKNPRTDNQAMHFQALRKEHGDYYGLVKK